MEKRMYDNDKNYYYWIPLDVWFKVLILLPVRSLVALRAVCKPFLSAIDDPEFVSSHLRRYPGNASETRILVKERSLSSANVVYHVREIAKFAELSPTSTEQITLEEGGCFVGTPVGSLDGLLLLSPSRGTRAWLWNPSVRKHRHLSPPLTKSEIKLFALGYEGGDYKVVAVSACREEAWVYALRAGNWTQVVNSGVRSSRFGEETVYSERLFLGGGGDGVVWVEGRKHKDWNSIKRSPIHTHRLVWFRFGAEKFRYADKMPYCVDRRQWFTDHGLVLLDGGDSVGAWGIDAHAQPCVWALQPDDMSWTTRYKLTTGGGSVPLLPGSLARCVTLTERDGKLVWQYWDQCRQILTFSYHIEKQPNMASKTILSTHQDCNLESTGTWWPSFRCTHFARRGLHLIWTDIPDPAGWQA